MSVEQPVVVQDMIKKKFEDVIDIPSKEFVFGFLLQQFHFKVGQFYLNTLIIFSQIQQSIQK